MESPVIEGVFVVLIEELFDELVESIDGHPIGGEDIPIEVEDHRDPLLVTAGIVTVIPGSRVISFDGASWQVRAASF